MLTTESTLTRSTRGAAGAPSSASCTSCAASPTGTRLLPSQQSPSLTCSPCRECSPSSSVRSRPRRPCRLLTAHSVITKKHDQKTPSSIGVRLGVDSDHRSDSLAALALNLAPVDTREIDAAVFHADPSCTYAMPRPPHMCLPSHVCSACQAAKAPLWRCLSKLLVNRAVAEVWHSLVFRSGQCTMLRAHRNQQ